MSRIPALYVAPSPRGGRGVFTAEPLMAGSIIEICPVIVLPAADRAVIHNTHLHDYYFLWEDEQCAIALGYGSLYNHASVPNAEYGMDYEQLTIDVFCIRDIAAGEEITIDYISGGNERSELWFAER